MIAVTRFDGSPILINADLIESIEQTPDTVLSFLNGHKLLVRDAPADLVQRVIEYKRAVHRGSSPRDALTPVVAGPFVSSRP